MTEAAESARVEPRTNLFVLAAMSAERVSGPVKVRNLSASGALIEGVALPSLGERLILRRGDNFIAGRVVWCEGGKAGLHFESPVRVQDWLPNRRSGQTGIDAAFHGIRSDQAIAPTAGPTIGPFAACDLLQLAEGIDVLAGALVNDPAVVTRLGDKLRALDIASQTLRKLARLG